MPNIEGYSGNNVSYLVGNSSPQPVETPIKILGKTSVKQDLSDVLKIFKYGKTWVQIQFYKLSGNEEQKQILKHKLRHLKLDVMAHEIQNTFSKNMIVSAKNIMKLDPFKSKIVEEASQKYIDQKDQFLLDVGLTPTISKSQESFVQQLAKLRKEVKGGVCAGACTDFAKKIVHDLSLENILEVAQNFKSGAPSSAVINQFAADKIKVARATAQAVNFIKDRRITYVTTINKLINHFNISVISKTNPFATEKQFYSQFMSELIVLQSENKLSGLEVHQLIEKHTEQQPQHGRLFNAIGMGVLKSLNTIELGNQSKDLAAKSVDQPQESGYFNKMLNVVTDTVSAAYKGASEFLSETFAATSQTTISHQVTNLTQDMSKKVMDSYEAVAYARGLQLGKNLIDSEKDDRKKLEILSSLEKGVYELDLSIAEGLSHATLVIKTKENTFFWDPNFGLMKCDEDNPEEVVLKALSLYNVSKELKYNHRLVLKEIKSL